MRQKAGRKTRTNLSIKNLDKTSRKTLVTEAKRVRTPYTWSELYSHSKVAQYSAV